MDDRKSYFFCYECGNTLLEIVKGLCPVCLENEIISVNFATLSPIPEEMVKAPHISLALMDDERNVWWDEVIETEDGPYITLVKLPDNYGFIPRWLLDFENNALIDPITQEDAIRATLNKVDK